jgi:hypothetical protein
MTKTAEYAPVFLGPLQTTALFLSGSRNPIDITANRCSSSAYTGTHLKNKNILHSRRLFPFHINKVFFCTMQIEMR